MKYGIAIKIVETGYVEVDADCEEEAKDLAEEAVTEGRVLFHDMEVESAEVERIFE